MIISSSSHSACKDCFLFSIISISYVFCPSTFQFWPLFFTSLSLVIDTKMLGLSMVLQGYLTSFLAESPSKPFSSGLTYLLFLKKNASRNFAFSCFLASFSLTFLYHILVVLKGGEKINTCSYSSIFLMHILKVIVILFLLFR